MSEECYYLIDFTNLMEWINYTWYTVPITVIIINRYAVLTLQFCDWSEFPVINEILKKHGADEEKQLGQAQFAVVLQSILQDLADALAEKHIFIIQNIKIRNGSKIIKVTSAFRFSLLRIYWLLRSMQSTGWIYQWDCLDCLLNSWLPLLNFKNI